MAARRARRVLAATVLVAVGAAACTPGGDPEPTTGPTETAARTVFPADQVAPLVDGMVHRTVKPLPTTRLADGLAPPTNRWFSGLVFGEEPQPVFPLPLSFGLTETGFAFGQPVVTTGAQTIAGGYQPAIDVGVGAAQARVSAYDTLAVTLEHLDADGDVLGRTGLAQGSPFVRYTAERSGSLDLALPPVGDGDVWTVQAGATAYGLVVQGGSVTGQRVELEEGGSATWFPVPADGTADRLAELARTPVTGGSARYRIGEDEVSTTLSYGSETAFAVRPHQQSGLADGTACELGSYPSIYGTLRLCTGTELTYTVPARPATGALDLGELSGGERDELAGQVRRDVAALPVFPADTYFGGKALYRAAMLYRLAVDTGATDAAEAVKAKLVETLSLWADPQGCAQRPAFCFVYDEQGRGVVGLTPSFGSDEYNDHHFHYGYFLYAAAVLAADDPALATRWAPVLDLLAADLASVGGNGLFPDRRNFDVYAGHSWASGTAPFADGNNQESSSEAVTAWTGLALWGDVRGNADLAAEARWMLATEAAAGLAYWTNVDLAQPVYAGYGHQIVTLNWGGKRDYATWFSPEAAAKLGILVIPMSPSSTYLAGDPARIEANVAEATGGRYDQKFGDYLLMYRALAGEDQREAALEVARELDAQWVDDGNSRSYLLAWLMSVRS